jgi:hypothetical protein
VADILIRGLPDEVVAALDANARRAGLSRTEYLRRLLTRERHDASVDLKLADLEFFADAFSDLADPEVMREAWR